MSGRIIPVLMCGGVGSRLWPLSRSADPKQFQPLASDDSMLVETLKRFEGPLFGDPMMLGNAAHLDLIHSHLRAAGKASYQILIEPVVRSTGPAIAAAAVALAAEGRNALMLVSPSDHIVGDPQTLRNAVAVAAPAAADGAIALFGITPDKPETGFGYIRAKMGPGAVLDVAGFIEKPKAERAVELLKSGDCFWNSGMFLFSVATVLEELQRYAPEVLRAAEGAVAKGRRDGNTLWLEEASFAAAPPLSIDYAVMEKSSRCKVVPVSPQWSDVGSWEALWEVGLKDAAGNVAKGDTMLHQTRNTLVDAGSERLVAVLGVDDLIVVDTADAVLVMSREKSQDVKSIVTALDKAARSESRHHRRKRRSWGSEEILAAGHGSSTERVVVVAGHSANIEGGRHRVVVTLSGRGKLTAGKVTSALAAGASHAVDGEAFSVSADANGDLDLLLVSWQAGAGR